MPHSTYMRDKLGTAAITPSGPVVAGSMASFDLVYTAGYFGIDDTGSIKIVQRYASDMAKPQFAEPAEPNYVSVEASNAAALDYRFDVKNNIRPWGKTLYIKVLRGYLQQGDQIIVHFGDRRAGSPGIRMQTFGEDTFELKVLVDAFATYDYVELPQSPTLRIIPGKPVRWQAVLPTLRRIGQPFRLSLKAEDVWGNPSDKIDMTVFLKPSHPVKDLPDQVTFEPGQFAQVVENLTVDAQADVTIDVVDATGTPLARTNPCRITNFGERIPFWADMHGQSEETIGTNSARDYFTFARDRAFLDVACHQGNDFQITNPFWAQLQQLTANFNEPGRFVTFPGYEWSGNTSLGGDHNIIFRNENEQIHRSCHALVHDVSDSYTDRHTTRDLFDTLKNRDAFVYAHVGGRYADLNVARDAGLQPAIEIHSAWGTFEWLLHDAFELGLRVGIVANSDGHKGRPGASYPGASMFGSYGGLTCFLSPELTRDAIFESLHNRHHYATTGCRTLLDTAVLLDDGKRRATMGDILTTDSDCADLSISVLAPAPIERIDLFNGAHLIETLRPYTPDDLGRRIRIIWQGAQCRGRGRETVWDGAAELSGNTFEKITPINFWNPQKPLVQQSPNHLSWKSITTGGCSGFEALLTAPHAGAMRIKTPLIEQEVEIARIGMDDIVFEAGGLYRQLKLFRLPDEHVTYQWHISRQITLHPGKDNPIYVRLTQNDGHVSWSSPIYLVGSSG